MNDKNPSPLQAPSKEAVAELRAFIAANADIARLDGRTEAHAALQRYASVLAASSRVHLSRGKSVLMIDEMALGSATPKMMRQALADVAEYLAARTDVAREEGRDDRLEAITGHARTFDGLRQATERALQEQEEGPVEDSIANIDPSLVNDVVITDSRGNIQYSSLRGDQLGLNWPHGVRIETSDQGRMLRITAAPITDRR